MSPLAKLLIEFGVKIPGGGMEHAQGILREEPLLRAIAPMFQSDRMPSADLAEKLGMDQQELARRLRPCGITPFAFKVSGNTLRRGYRRAEFTNAVVILDNLRTRPVPTPEPSLPPAKEPEPLPEMTADQRWVTINNHLPRKPGLNFSLNAPTRCGRRRPEWSGI